MSAAGQAALWGALSAVSLPLGAIVGTHWRPHSKVTSTLMAFGAGALLFALSVELMAEVPEQAEQMGLIALFAGVGGALAGGLIFDVLNQFLNNRGAFLRNLSTLKEHIANTKRRRAQRLLHRLSQLPAFADVPPEALAGFVSHVKRRQLADGEQLFAAGDSSDELHFVRRGVIEMRSGGDGPPRVFDSLDPVADLGALNRKPRAATAVARGPTVVYILDKDDVEAAAAVSPPLRQALQSLAATPADSYGNREDEQARSSLYEAAEDDLHEMHMPVEEADFTEHRDVSAHAVGVATAIWLGIAIDAVPESLVIGTLAISADGMSIAFIVGVFLANFPEAMSSSISMRKAGMSQLRILVMWGSLCLLTAAGAGAGALLFASVDTAAPGALLIFIEALAAGAMLTAIAETMLPEAFEQGGSIVGIATLAGFLAALVAASLG